MSYADNEVERKPSTEAPEAKGKASSTAVGTSSTVPGATAAAVMQGGALPSGTLPSPSGTLVCKGGDHKGATGEEQSGEVAQKLGDGSSSTGNTATPPASAAAPITVAPQSAKTLEAADANVAAVATAVSVPVRPPFHHRRRASVSVSVPPANTAQAGAEAGGQEERRASLQVQLKQIRRALAQAVPGAVVGGVSVGAAGATGGTGVRRKSAAGSPRCRLSSVGSVSAEREMFARGATVAGAEEERADGNIADPTMEVEGAEVAAASAMAGEEGKGSRVVGDDPEEEDGAQARDMTDDDVTESVTPLAMSVEVLSKMVQSREAMKARADELQDLISHTELAEKALAQGKARAEIRTRITEGTAKLKKKEAEICALRDRIANLRLRRQEMSERKPGCWTLRHEGKQRRRLLRDARLRWCV